jgi:hypothetical protein
MGRSLVKVSFELALILAVPLSALAGGAEKSVSGFIDFNGYYDTRDFNVLTLNILADLPARFQYFSLTNYFGSLNTNQNFDLENFLTEQNLRWGLPGGIPLDLTYQWLIQSGAGNDLGRFGFRWRLSSTPWLDRLFKKLRMTYSINFHLLQTDFHPSPGFGWQVEHVYRINLLKDRLYIYGFADHNMNYGGGIGGNNHRWVSETQLGVRLIAGLHAVAEFRRNEFLSEKNGLGLGLEYLIRF